METYCGVWGYPGMGTWFGMLALLPCTVESGGVASKCCIMMVHERMGESNLVRVRGGLGFYGSGSLGLRVFRV